MNKQIIMGMLKKIYTQSIDKGKTSEEAFLLVKLNAENVKNMCLNFDVDELVKEIEKEIKAIEKPLIIRECEIKPWLNEYKSKINWNHYKRFREYMIKKGFPINMMDSTDEITDEIIDMMGNPEIHEKFDVRGMVVGYVQSGKTNNYITLINKAIDCGYKLIIILAGMYNDLRSQTQCRIDEQILGLETSIEKNNKNTAQGVGLGDLGEKIDIKIQYLTSREQQGDFKISRANSQGKHIKEVPHVLVVKKNSSILKNLNKYLKELGMQDLPMLLIDDEADQASVNTKKQDEKSIEYDRTTINEHINNILNKFNRKTYVGYTATPYANVFITKEGDEDNYKDIFPKDFIISMPKPDKYQGAEEIFGYDYEKHFREIDDLDELINKDNIKNKDASVSDLSDVSEFNSLKKAVYSFLCVIAIKELRGISGHNSMLVHLVRFKNVQSSIYRELEDFIKIIRNSIRYDKNSKLVQSIVEILKEEYPNEYTNKEVILKLIEKNLDPLMFKIKELNGNSKDSLDYIDNKKLNVIAVGGNKLSRGLTLEGLSISYYMRASKAYDTLTQMGRWFGYRKGYEDLCRVYTSSDILDYFQKVSIAEKELREMLGDMARKGETPKQFQIRVRYFPGLMVTAANKRRNAIARRISYADSTVETTTFDLSNHNNNYNAVLNLINNSNPKEIDSNNDSFNILKGVEASVVIDFLDEYKTSRDAIRVNNESISNFISTSSIYKEFQEWDIYVRNVKRGDPCHPLNVNCGERGIRRGGVLNAGDTINIGSLIIGKDRLEVGVEKSKLFEGMKDEDAKKLRKKGKGHIIIYPFHLKETENLKRINYYDSKIPHIGVGFIFGGSDIDLGKDYLENKTHKY